MWGRARSRSRPKVAEPPIFQDNIAVIKPLPPKNSLERRKEFGSRDRQANPYRPDRVIGPAQSEHQQRQNAAPQSTPRAPPPPQNRPTFQYSSTQMRHNQRQEFCSHDRQANPHRGADRVIGPAQSEHQHQQRQQQPNPYPSQSYGARFISPMDPRSGSKSNILKRNGGGNHMANVHPQIGAKRAKTSTSIFKGNNTTIRSEESLADSPSVDIDTNSSSRPFSTRKSPSKSPSPSPQPQPMPADPIRDWFEAKEKVARKIAENMEKMLVRETMVRQVQSEFVGFLQIADYALGMGKKN